MKTVLKISAKCSDMFSAFLSEEGKPTLEYADYVPHWFPNSNVNHYGDYVHLTIDVETGQILNWRKPTAAQLKETFSEKEE